VNVLVLAAAVVATVGIAVALAVNKRGATPRVMTGQMDTLEWDETLH
jgi:hypothetical protein